MADTDERRNDLLPEHAQHAKKGVSKVAALGGQTGTVQEKSEQARVRNVQVRMEIETLRGGVE